MAPALLAREGPAPSERPIIIHEGLTGPVAGSGSPRREDSAEGIRARIAHLWFARKAALDAGDTVTAASRVEELRNYMLQEGITADRMIARGFAYEGYENLREGNFERAREAYDLARSFDPYLPQAQIGYAWSLLRAGRGVFAFLEEYRKGLRLAWSQFITDEVQISNFSVVMAIALLCGMIAFSVAVIARCQGRVRHDLFEAVRGILPEGMARVTAWAVFLLPLIAGAMGLWLVLYWLALCFRYMRVAERVAAAAVFLIIGLAPVGVSVVLERVQASTDPEMRVILSAMQAGYNPETVRHLRQVAKAHDDTPELHLLLGSSLARGDLLGEAFDEYQKVLELVPGSPAAQVNVGNIYFRLGEHAQAANHYKQALQIRPDLVSGWWNLHLAQTELLHFAEADASLVRARELDSTLTGTLLAQRKGKGTPALLLEEPARLGALKNELRSRPRNRLAIGELLSNPMSLASGTGLLLALALGLARSHRAAQACVRCGRAYCSRCRVDQGTAGWCSRCVTLFWKKQGFTADVRAQEMARLGRRDRATAFVRRVLSLLLPGSGLILAGRLAIGFPVMMGWVSAIVFLLTRDRLLLAPSVPVSDLPPPGVMTAAFLMLLMWIIGNTASARRQVATGMNDGS